jgi:hypothetical protein
MIFPLLWGLVKGYFVAGGVPMDISFAVLIPRTVPFLKRNLLNALTV